MCLLGVYRSGADVDQDFGKGGVRCLTGSLFWLSWRCV